MVVKQLEAWAQLHEEEKRARNSGRMVVSPEALKGSGLRRVAHAIAEAGDAGFAYVGTQLTFYVPAGRRTEPSNADGYVTLQAAAASAAAPKTNCCIWLRASPPRAGLLHRATRLVWMHSHASGGSPGDSLLTGAPEPLLKMLENSGLRDLLAPKEAQPASDSGRSLYVSVLRWHGTPLVHAVLEAAYRHALAGAQGSMTVWKVVHEKSSKSKGRQGSASWACLTRPVRPIHTVVLPPEAEAIRQTAKAFVSRSYRTFCKAKGMPHRCGFALWVRRRLTWCHAAHAR